MTQPQQHPSLINPSLWRRAALSVTISALSLLAGCPDPGDQGEVTSPSRYSFNSRFESGVSGVDYRGQTMRHALLHALVHHIEGLPERILAGLTPTPGSVRSELELFYDCPDELCLAQRHGVELERPTAQSTLGELSSGKSLSEKVAGQDEVGQHRDWLIGAGGWSSSALSPDEQVRLWFEVIDAQAQLLAEGGRLVDPQGQPLSGPHLTPEGLNLAELIEKYLYGALAFSQASDDYLDDDLEGKGLLSDNVADDGGYTALEHAWDEGFGYLGAARDLMSYSATEIAGSGGRPSFQRAHDSDDDGVIDLHTEYHWGVTRYAASRDRDGESDFAQRAFMAFVQGRALISSVDGALDEAQLDELRGYRDEALQAWEGALAASAIHYLNEVLTHLNQGDEAWSFEEHATHWSELKGFALSFQFNPRSALSDEDFEVLHEAIGDRPTFPSAEEADAHREALLEVRGMLGERFGFTEDQLSAW